MRIKITRAQRSTVDGVPLSAFVVGQTYDVPSSLATYLVTLGAAELIDQTASLPAGSTTPSRRQSLPAENQHTTWGWGRFSADE